MSIDRICCIIDFDGFSFRNYTSSSSYKKEFLIREIGFVRVDPLFGTFLAKSYRFDLRFFDFTHSKEALATINHQTRHVSGLTFKPENNEEVHNYDEKYKIIKSIYKTCLQPGLDTIAFKSGVFEKRILEELGIPWIDLEVYGCPTYKRLIEEKVVFSQLIDCGYHKRISDSEAFFHCPRAEVIAFRDWLILNHPVSTPRNRISCGSTEEPLLSASHADSLSDVSTSSD